MEEPNDLNIILFRKESFGFCYVWIPGETHTSSYRCCSSSTAWRVQYTHTVRTRTTVCWRLRLHSPRDRAVRTSATETSRKLCRAASRLTVRSWRHVSESRGITTSIWVGCRRTTPYPLVRTPRGRCHWLHHSTILNLWLHRSMTITFGSFRIKQTRPMISDFIKRFQP